jgi:hypothetical protein
MLAAGNERRDREEEERTQKRLADLVIAQHKERIEEALREERERVLQEKAKENAERERQQTQAGGRGEGRYEDTAFWHENEVGDKIDRISPRTSPLKPALQAPVLMTSPAIIPTRSLTRRRRPHYCMACGAGQAGNGAEVCIHCGQELAVLS